MTRTWDGSWSLLISSLEEMNVPYFYREGMNKKMDMYLMPHIEVVVGDSIIIFTRGH